MEAPRALPRATVRSAARLPLRAADDAVCTAFDGLIDGRDDHVALSFPLKRGGAPLARIHSECLTGDAFGSLRCDCGPQLEEAIRRCSAEGGVILYLRQEGRGIGLAAKLEAYGLQDGGLDTFAANEALGHAADGRDYRVAAQMLLALGFHRIRLLSNNPDKASQLAQAGVEVVAVEPTGLHESAHNQKYLDAKRSRGGHWL